jgi:alanyl-tRNA synthetase
MSSLSNVVSSYEKIALFALRKRDDEKINYLIAIKNSGSDDTHIYQTLRGQLLDSFQAKGGGKAPLWQGIATVSPEETPSLLEHVEQLLQQSIV